MAVSVDQFENLLDLDLHGPHDCHLAVNWEGLLGRGTHVTTEAVGLAVVTCTSIEKDRIVCMCE